MKKKKIKVYSASFLSSLEEPGGFKGLFNKVINLHDDIDRKIRNIKGEGMNAENKSLYNKLGKMKLGGSDYLVFLCLLGHLDYYNRVTVRQKDIAELCRMSRPQVSRSIKKLKEMGVLEDTKDLIVHFDLLFRGPSKEYEVKKSEIQMKKSPFNRIIRGDNWGGDITEKYREEERKKAIQELDEEEKVKKESLEKIGEGEYL